MGLILSGKQMFPKVNVFFYLAPGTCNQGRTSFGITLPSLLDTQSVSRRLIRSDLGCKPSDN